MFNPTLIFAQVQTVDNNNVFFDLTFFKKEKKELFWLTLNSKKNRQTDRQTDRPINLIVYNVISWIIGSDKAV